ncbi:restriction endonuclease subunit S [Campylobacter upsaliensis]|uniref:restriction endonuclease subunit S n=1 Tax=Campylobacter upsaliensis TaxID=28080 RepID=UPI002149E95E|nr:restriction endonuclease subunit S [Campylobacter upsaliensis]MCR2125074.1 restriction endonuclease subunit S [Campylobacter upsaliensis]
MAEIFTRKFSEVSGGSFQPEAYHYERLEIIEKLQKLYKNNLSKLSHIANIISQKSNAKNVKKYVGMANIESHTGIYIESVEDKGQGDCNIFKKGDVLFGKLRPYLNKVYFAEFEGGCSTEFIVLNSKDSNKISNRFLSIFLMLDCVVRQTKHLMTGNTLPRLQTSDIENLLIPLPPLSTQQHIIDLMDKAYKAKQKKENKAKELLDSIDSYLLEELGIILPLRANNTLETRIYTAKISALSGSRFDANYHQKYYRDLEKSLFSSPYPLVNLASLINNFKKGIEVGSSEYSQNKEIPFIRVSDITNNGIDFSNVQKFISASLFENLKAYKPKENELLYSKDGTVGICLEADTSCDYIISGGILRLELKAEVDKDFLCFLLGSYIMNVFANRVSIGAVIKHLNIGEFLNLKIPLPPLALQTQIASRLKNSKFQALSLEKEAKEILHKAKIDVEALLLTAGGGVTLAFSFEAFISTQTHYFDKMAKIWNEREYSVVRLGEVGIMQNGSLISEKLYTHKKGRAYIRIKDLSFKEDISLNSAVFIDESFKPTNEVRVKENDIVFATIGATIGKVNLVTQELAGSFISNNTSKFSIFNQLAYPAFCTYIFQSNFFQEFIKQNTTITAQPKITNECILNLKIPLPPLTEQERIAKEISQRKARAKVLKQEAKELLENAKKEVEQIILGG